MMYASNKDFNRTKMLEGLNSAYSQTTDMLQEWAPSFMRYAENKE